jgi:hypothetical protein
MTSSAFAAEALPCRCITVRFPVRSRPKQVIEYCHGNRVISISGGRTAISRLAVDTSRPDVSSSILNPPQRCLSKEDEGKLSRRVDGSQSGFRSPYQNSLWPRHLDSMKASLDRLNQGNRHLTRSECLFSQ